MPSKVKLGNMVVRHIFDSMVVCEILKEGEKSWDIPDNAAFHKSKGRKGKSGPLFFSFFPFPPFLPSGTINPKSPTSNTMGRAK
jgi:hypothetical protein